MDENIARLTEVAVRQGMLKERNRVLEILIRYKKAGWLDEAFAILLAEDICRDETEVVDGAL